VLVRYIANLMLGLRFADGLPEPMDRSFVDRSLGRGQCDGLFRYRLTPGGPSVYVLVEHKSGPATGTGFQLHRHRNDSLERHAADFAAAPPFVLFDIGRRSLKPLLERSPIVWAFLSAMRFARFGWGDGDLERVLSAMPAGSALLAPLLAYILLTSGIAWETLAAVSNELLPEKELETMGALAQELIGRGRVEGLARGLAKGKAEGKAEGKIEGLATGLAKGKIEGKAESLERVLELRFGPLSASDRDRIANASVEQLETWLDASIEAASISGVFSSRTLH